MVTRVNYTRNTPVPALFLLYINTYKGSTHRSTTLLKLENYNLLGVGGKKNLRTLVAHNADSEIVLEESYTYRVTRHRESMHKISSIMDLFFCFE